MVGATVVRKTGEFAGTFQFTQRSLYLGKHLEQIMKDFGISEGEVWPLIKNAVQSGTVHDPRKSPEGLTVAFNYLVRGSTFRVVVNWYLKIIWDAYPGTS